MILEGTREIRKYSYDPLKENPVPTKTKKNPNVVLSDKLRAIMCDRIQEFVEENELDYHWEDIPQKIASSWKKMGIVCAEMEPFYFVEFATQMINFSNENQGCVIVLLVSDEKYEEEMETGEMCDGQMEGVPVCAVPLALAQKIVKKGSI